MKRQGETETNPRFMQLSSQLLAIQRAQSMKSAQAQQHHPVQQHPQPQQAQPPQQHQQQQPRQVDVNQIQPGPAGQQGSPLMSIPQQRPQENGQPNGTFTWCFVFLLTNRRGSSCTSTSRSNSTIIHSGTVASVEKPNPCF